MKLSRGLCPKIEESRDEEISLQISSKLSKKDFKTVVQSIKNFENASCMWVETRGFEPPKPFRSSPK